MSDIAERFDGFPENGIPRRSRLVSGPRGARAMVDGRACLLLCSDNYLGIADHPKVRAAASEAAARWGAGTGAPRCSSGEMESHRRLERSLAEFIGYEAALVQGPCQLSVPATVAALARPGEVVFTDGMNHPGIEAGCMLSGAETRAYRHRDVEYLEWALDRAEGRASLIVTESVFGAEGDRAPVEELSDLAAAFDCRMIVDESHAIGSVGPEGRGLVASLGLSGEVDVVIGSLGKALGSYGSFVACHGEMAEYLAGTSASMRFSTALPPATVAAAAASLAILREDPYRVERLRVNAAVLRASLEARGVSTSHSESQIVAVPAVDAGAAEEACDRALEAGVLVGSIEPPLLPEGEAALRLTAIATHRASELEAAAEVVSAASRGAGIAAAEPLRPVPSPRRVTATERAPELEVPAWIERPGQVELPDWIRAA